MAFGDYLRVLRTYWRSILAVAAAGLLLGGATTFAITPMYTATSQVLFTADAGDGGGQDLAFGQTYVQGRMINYADIATKEYVLGPVVSLPELNLTLTPKQLGERVTADFVPTSTILSIHVEDESRTQAARIAAAVAQSLINQVEAAEEQAPIIDGESTEPKSLVRGRPIANPTAPDSPSSPQIPLYLAAGAMFGLILGVAIALIRNVRAQAAPKAPRPVQPAAPAASLAPPAPPAPPAQVRPQQPVPPPFQPGAVPPPAAPNAQGGTPPIFQPSELQPAEKPQKVKRPGRRTRR